MLIDHCQVDESGDFLQGDMGQVSSCASRRWFIRLPSFQGFGFRPGTFDGCISISALQWLCNSDVKSDHWIIDKLYGVFRS